MCVELGVKGDVHKIEQFYSEVSGINLEIAGLIDLSALTLVVGYQMNTRGMTLMEDPVEPEPVPDMEQEKEENPVASGSRCKRSTAPGHTRRKQTKTLKPWTQDMILDGVYWTNDSKLESIEDGWVLLSLTRDIIDFDKYPNS